MDEAQPSSPLHTNTPRIGFTSRVFQLIKPKFILIGIIIFIALLVSTGYYLSATYTLIPRSLDRPVALNAHAVYLRPSVWPLPPTAQDVTMPHSDISLPPPPLPPIPPPTEKAESQSLVGTVEKLPQNATLSAILTTTYGNNYQLSQLQNSNLYGAGTYTAGDLSGYKRYVFTSTPGSAYCTLSGYAVKDNSYFPLTTYGFPQSIDITTMYTLSRGAVYTPYQSGKEGNDTCSLGTMVTKNKSLSLPANKYKVYATNDTPDNFVTDNAVVLVDLTGFPMSYTIFSLDDLNFSHLKTDTSVYSNYYPGLYNGSYKNGADRSIKNILSKLKEDDLKQIGTFNSGLALYTFKNQDNTINAITYGDTTEGCNALALPTYQDYIQKPPIVFVKDYWNRYVLYEETDHHHGCGGGKPVIYLYPTKPTDISVKFKKQMDLSVQIPNYSNGWHVHATPLSMLTDLQPMLTPCSTIDIKKFGSEYAADACKHNSYPYIYWAGDIHNQSMPLKREGWTVERNNLSQFLNTKLDGLGLTTKEKDDMLSYWVPVMQKQRSAYYHVAFILTDEMNMLVPYTISPKPDSMLRVFLDWAPLSDKPKVDPKPQALDKFTRNGFTLVEWGGLKYP